MISAPTPGLRPAGGLAVIMLAVAAAAALVQQVSRPVLHSPTSVLSLSLTYHQALCQYHARSRRSALRFVGYNSNKISELMLMTRATASV